ncbi:MAG TPA: GNAT family N-acetyltransferase [Polynucleobacter sp.]|nr:GNAT family N-acetyltransferase [Polynucleobacter sp.]
MTKQEAYQARIIHSISEVPEASWNALLPNDANPFLKHAFLEALEATDCIGGNTGWQAAHLIIEDGEGSVVGAMPMYLKQHSYGEFVFDWSWAQAYEQNGLNYYPKALVAIPFTPVQGARLLVDKDHDDKLISSLLLSGLKNVVQQNGLSSAHILFPSPDEIAVLEEQEFMLRDSVQFHWHNQGYQNFDDFLAALTMKRRKNIRRERAQLLHHQLEYRHIGGSQATLEDWSFFYQCYANTYLERRSSPYLTEDFFQEIAKRMPEHLHLIIACRSSMPIAASLLVVDHNNSQVFGRYWGAIEHIPLLHFEVAYYQAIEYCIREGIQTFEGGAQGEHKMARGFLPTTLHSAHWIADPGFSKAVGNFLKRERNGVAAYVDELEQHNPLKSTTVQP